MQETLIIFVLGIISIGIHSIFISNKHGIIFWISVISIFVVHIFIWNMFLNQRAAIIFLLIYYYAWNYRYDIDKMEVKEKFQKFYVFVTKLVTVIMVMISIFSIRNVHRLIKTEIENPYCGGKDMASYIKENINEDSVFISQVPSYISTVIAYLDGENYEFYETVAQRNYTFKTWDDENYDNDIRNYDKAIEKYQGRDIYIIEEIPYTVKLEEFLKYNPGIEYNANLIYKTGEESMLGTYYLWKVENK